MNDDRTCALRRALDSARDEINRQRADLALEYLDAVRYEIEQISEGSLWAEHRLLLAEATGAKGDPAAESLFEEALERINKLVEPHTNLLLRAHTHYGDYLLCFARRPSLAQPHYEHAKAIAVGNKLPEETASLQLKLVRVHLEMDRDDQLDNFKIFRRVASKGGHTRQVQLAAWNLHYGGLGQSQAGLRFARKRASATDEYFLNLLESVRKT